jgi:hypothetical protein
MSGTTIVGQIYQNFYFMWNGSPYISSRQRLGKPTWKELMFVPCGSRKTISFFSSKFGTLERQNSYLPFLFILCWQNSHGKTRTTKSYHTLKSVGTKCRILETKT